LTLFKFSVMKLTEQQQAQRLFFQTDLSRSEIAEFLNIQRSTLNNWIHEYHWDRLKESGQCMPAFLAQNIYLILGRLTNHLLSEERADQPVTAKEANTLYKLTVTIDKLSKRSTLSELMQTFTRFSDKVKATDPSLVDDLQPIIREFIAAETNPGKQMGQPTAPANSFPYGPGVHQASGEAPLQPDARPDPSAGLRTTPVAPVPASAPPANAGPASVAPAPNPVPPTRRPGESALHFRMRTGAKLNPGRQHKAA
jgi:hypothetical protein